MLTVLMCPDDFQIDSFLLIKCQQNVINCTPDTVIKINTCYIYYIFYVFYSVMKIFK